MLKHRYHNQSRYNIRKKYVHICKLPIEDTIKIEEHYLNSCILMKKLILSCLITTDVYRRKVYSKSQKVLENERRTHLSNYTCIIHPFSDFAYFWELFMIIVFFVQLSVTPVFIILRKKHIMAIYFMLITQILCCLNILVSCITGYYRTDIKKVVLDQKKIILNSIKNGNLVIDLLGGFPFSYISYACGTSILTERVLSCFISFNICPLIRYLDKLQQKRGFSFMIFRLLYIFLVFIFGMCWLTVLIFVGVHYDQKAYNNVTVWWWFNNTFSFLYGTKMTDFWFIGYEFFFTTVAIIFGIFMKNIIIVQLIIMGKTWYSSERKRASFFKELNEFCHYKRLPYNLKQRLVQYYKFKLHDVYYNEAEIENQLSENLRSDIKDYKCRAWFEADIFQLCPSVLRQLITMHLDEEIYFKNDVIYQNGDLCNHIYFIKSGSIMRIHEDTNELYEISEGNFFSEKALLEINEPHTSTVIVMESSQLLILSRWIFLKLIENYQTYYATILDILERRKTYLFKGIKLKSRLQLGDYYRIRRSTNFEET